MFRAIYILSFLVLSACSTNPATGTRQFTALMSEQQEKKIGLEAHPQALAAFGGEVENEKLKSYVTEIGQQIARNTERRNVEYTFTLLDSPVVNAFAVPGGYIYITRGILTMATDEAELAAVIAHEIGHITARHSAERYSQSVLVGLGAAAASIALDNKYADDALNLGSQLFLTSYSREQEREADYLGVRYLNREGYQPIAMADFLKQLQKDEVYQKSLKGSDAAKSPGGIDVYFRTHPLTSERIQNAQIEAGKYLNFTQRNRDKYLSMIDGMVYGDSPKQGLIIGQTFLHPDLNFKIKAPQGYEIQNSPDRIIVKKDKTVVQIDIDAKARGISPRKYLDTWKPETVDRWDIKPLTVNGFEGANASTQTRINGQIYMLRHVVIIGPQDNLFRFQILSPKQTALSEDQNLFDMIFSFDDLNARDRAHAKPMRIDIFTARSGDRIASVAKRMPAELKNKQSLFRTINGLSVADKLQAGQKYKTIVR